jgi:DNA-binding YbaB/EbfC family protein
VKGLGQILKKAQQMQAELARAKEALGSKTVEATAGGGMVKVVANGRKEILSITVDPQIVDPTDLDMLQDLVCAGVNEALRKVQAVEAEEMQKIAGGLGLPVDFQGFFGI